MNKPSRTTFRARLDTMVQQLREDIISGRLTPGSYLPSEEVLGEQFQLSKKSVRKGLETLVNENLIVKKAKVGNMVLSPSGNSDRISIRFCYYPDVDQESNIHNLLDEFESRYPHIQVKRLTMHTLQYSEQAIEFMNDSMLDVIMLNYYDFSYFNNKSHLKLLTEQEIDPTIYSFLNRAFVVDGKSYVKPFTFSPVILCYNKKHFQEAGLQEPDSSWTWDDFNRAAEALTDTEELNKRFGFFFYLLSQNRWPLWLLQNHFMLQKNEEGKYSLNDEAFIKSIHMLKELFSQEYSAPSFVFESAQDPERLFIEERTSMILTTYFRLNTIKSVPFEYDISPVPYVDTPITLLLNIGLAISSQSQQKEAAQLLVDFLTSKEAQESVRNSTLSLPSMKEVAEQDRTDKRGEPSRFQMFREIIPSFRYYSDMNIERYHLRIMTHYLKMYWSDLDSAANVIASIEQVLNNDKSNVS